MTGTGKIARLPKAVQEELNRRLDNHELGDVLLAWLNGLPEVKAVLARLFKGKAVSKQNLSQWRGRGYREWQARQCALNEVRDMMSEMGDWQRPGSEPISAHLATWVAAHYLMAARDRMEDKQPNLDRLKMLRRLCADAVAMQRGDHRVAQRKLEQERFLFKKERLQSKAAKATGQSGSKQVKANQTKKSKKRFQPAEAPSPLHFDGTSRPANEHR